MSAALSALTTFVLVVGIITLACGAVKLCFVPLSVWFELRRWWCARRGLEPDVTATHAYPLVSVVVPAYNEGVVIENCLRSVLASDWPNLEVCCVDDGSSDDTVAIARAVAAEDSRLRVIAKSNGGKGSALNRGIAETSGEIVLLVDSDGVFAPGTVHAMVSAFDAPEVGAVCGDDRPVNLDRVLPQMLSVLSHVGTGMVRRALSLMDCLIIVSGNCGAFRRSALTEVGGLCEGTIGEDLELTWKLLEHGWSVRFEPRALVYAESPSTPRGLWKQRVRWARGLLQTMRMHPRLVIDGPGLVAPYVAFNTLTMVIAPVLQLLALAVLPFLIASGSVSLRSDVVALLAWSGLGTSLVLVLTAIALNHEWRDMRYLWTVLIWPVYATVMSLTMVSALYKEFTGQASAWNKLDRTGVVSRQVTA